MPKSRQGNARHDVIREMKASSLIVFVMAPVTILLAYGCLHEMPWWAWAFALLDLVAGLALWRGDRLRAELRSKNDFEQIGWSVDKAGKKS